MLPAYLEQSGPDVLIRVKAVPGASRDEIAGAVGDRLKVRISAPPEGGKANKAICAVLARSLNVKPNRVILESGASNPAKVLRILDARLEEVAASLTK